MNNEQTVSAARDSNLIPLANAIELATRVIQGLGDDLVQKTANSRAITDAAIGQAVAARVAASLSPYLGE